MSAAAELDVGRRELEALGDVAHAEKDVGASIASGSFKTDGMIIAPCSMRTLAAIATGVTDNLVDAGRGRHAEGAAPARFARARDAAARSCTCATW